MPTGTEFSAEVLRLDEAAEVKRIAARMREILRTDLHRRGLIIAISGGVDSAVCAALCVQAVGKDKVLGLLLPERDSSSNSARRGKTVAEQSVTRERVAEAPILIEQSRLLTLRAAQGLFDATTAVQSRRPSFRAEPPS